jgi:hypothetical protein
VAGQPGQRRAARERSGSLSTIAWRESGPWAAAKTAT